jgi:hypothetical protein
MGKIADILQKLTGGSRSQDLAYTKDESWINKWHDGKIEYAHAEIIKAVLESLPEDKKHNFLEYANADEEFNRGFNQCLKEVRERVGKL